MRRGMPPPPKIGGPPVRPYQPDGIWEEATFGQIRYEPDSGESLYRRSLYTFWRRTSPYPSREEPGISLP